MTGAGPPGVRPPSPIETAKSWRLSNIQFLTAQALQAHLTISLVFGLVVAVVNLQYKMKTSQLLLRWESRFHKLQEAKLDQVPIGNCSCL